MGPLASIFSEMPQNVSEQRWWMALHLSLFRPGGRAADARPFVSVWELPPGCSPALAVTSLLSGPVLSQVRVAPGSCGPGGPQPSRAALTFQIRTKWIPLVNGDTKRGPR